MAILARLSIQGLRNLAFVELLPAQGFNLFYGSNGAGKTSLLEAIYMLGRGKTFRSQQNKSLITEGLDRVSLFTQTTLGMTIGLERSLKGSPRIQINGDEADSLAELSYAIPIQLINSETLHILEGGPLDRRQFLDWGVFHVEHQFISAWRKAKRALQHRNALLRKNAGTDELEAWSKSLAASSIEIDNFRSRYIQLLSDEFLLLIQKELEFPQSLGGIENLSLCYYRGWQEGRDLEEELSFNLDKDMKNGYTSAGPHRADLIFQVNGKALASLFSRGQIKLLVCLLKIAQARILNRINGKGCIFLIDDLPAELDAENCFRICNVLARLQTPSQVFMTTVEEGSAHSKLVQALKSQEAKPGLFHVKHGTITSL